MFSNIAMILFSSFMVISSLLVVFFCDAFHVFKNTRTDTNGQLFCDVNHKKMNAQFVKGKPLF